MTAPLPRPPEPSPAPDQNGFARRVLLFAGLALMFGSLAGIAFVKGVASWVFVVMALLGGALIPNTRIVDLVHAWKTTRVP